MADELQTFSDDEGFVRLKETPRVKAGVTQLNEILANDPYMVSRWVDDLRHDHVRNLTEAIAPGDFPTLFGFLIQRDMLAKYAEMPSEWRRWIPTGTVPNFNVHRKLKVYGQDNELSVVLPGAPYPETVSATSGYNRSVVKYGRRFDILWEAIVNDALGAFSDIPARFATAVSRTQAKNATRIYSSAAGPNPALFGTPIVDVDGQNVTNQGVLPFNVTNLAITRRLLANQTDPNGERIGLTAKYLVVPGSLADAAFIALHSMNLQQAASATPVPTINPASNWGLQLIVDDYLETIDLTGTSDTTWYLFAEPGGASALQMDFLAGNIGPDIRIRSNGASSGNPMDGSFETDTIAYRVRDVHGGSCFEPRYCYAQVGP
jgi:hypothetical protein